MSKPLLLDHSNQSTDRFNLSVLEEIYGTTLVSAQAALVCKSHVVAPSALPKKMYFLNYKSSCHYPDYVRSVKLPQQFFTRVAMFNPGVLSRLQVG